MEEIWKDIEGYEGLYEVSSYGRVRSLGQFVNHNYGGYAYRKGRILKPGLGSKKYLSVTLSKNGIQKQYSVHRLVAQAFIPNINNLPIINHKDENKLNNCVDNLEWCDYKYNVNYGNRLNKFYDSRIKSGYMNPEHLGLDKKTIAYLASKAYRKREKEKKNNI